VWVNISFNERCTNTRNPTHYYDSRGSTIYWKQSFHTRVLAVEGWLVSWSVKFLIAFYCYPFWICVRSQSRFTSARCIAYSLNPRFHFQIIAKLALENYTDQLIIQTFEAFSEILIPCIFIVVYCFGLTILLLNVIAIYQHLISIANIIQFDSINRRCCKYCKGIHFNDLLKHFRCVF